MKEEEYIMLTTMTTIHYSYKLIILRLEALIFVLHFFGQNYKYLQDH